MSETKTQVGFNTYEALKAAVSMLSTSSNAQDLCRRLTHSEYFKGMCRGVSIYLLDQKSSLIQVAGYGDVPDHSQTHVSAWDDGFLASGIRSRHISHEHETDVIRACLPIELAGVVTGVVLFTMSPDHVPGTPSKDDSRLLANLAGLFMDTKGLTFEKRIPGASSKPEPEEVAVQELTTRQVQILHLMADGLTNAEISKLVLLSESTVRQETIRIFRILKCHTRSEAIVKARASGVIASVQKVAEVTAPQR